MSRIDDLIRELAPSGVKLTPLGELGEFVRGNGLQKADLTDSGMPAIHYGQVHTFYGTWASATKSFLNPDVAVKLRRARPGDLIIVTTSEDDDAVAKAVAWIGDEEVAVSSDAFIYRHSLDPRYVAYFFQTEQFKDQKMRHLTGTKVRRISGDALAKIRIPVAPIEVQREIVRILDNFTGLEAELQAELQARRRQYAHYRTRLLTFDESARTQWVPLGDLAQIGTGKSDRVDAVSGAAYPFFVRSQEVLSIDHFEYDEEAVIIPGEGGLGEIFHYVNGKYGLHQRAYRIRPTVNELDARYLYHYLVAHFGDYIRARAVTATVTSLRKPMLTGIPIPIPPKVDQRRIADILDKFDALVNDLSVGLPAELAARRKQYEHYRDRLLSFDEAA